MEEGGAGASVPSSLTFWAVFHCLLVGHRKGRESIPPPSPAPGRPGGAGPGRVWGCVGFCAGMVPACRCAARRGGAGLISICAGHQ